MALQLENEECEFSDRFKRKMNRVFRERVGTEKIPHPEVDNTYERIRSKIICLKNKMFHR